MAKETLQLEREDQQNPETVEVSTLKIANYPAAYAAHSAGDEFRLVEIMVNRPRGWAVGLTPDSYDVISAAVYRTSPGFFAYSARQSMTRSIATMAASVVRGNSG